MVMFKRFNFLLNAYRNRLNCSLPSLNGNYPFVSFFNGTIGSLFLYQTKGCTSPFIIFHMIACLSGYV